jgi:hypothetical protein
MLTAQRRIHYVPIDSGRIRCGSINLLCNKRQKEQLVIGGVRLYKMTPTRTVKPKTRRILIFNIWNRKIYDP